MVRLESKLAKAPYYNSKGEEVPSVTEVTDTLPKPGLKYYYWDLGRKGVSLQSSKDHYTGIGKIAHFMCELHGTGKIPDLSDFPPSQVSIAENAYLKFASFWDKEGFQPLHNELRLVSEQWGFGGQIDKVATDAQGRVCIVDLKTSKDIQLDYWIQLSAYEQLLVENLGLKLDRRMIVRIGKEESETDFDVQEKPSLTGYFYCFTKALENYKALKEIKWKFR